MLHFAASDVQMCRRQFQKCRKLGQHALERPLAYSCNMTAVEIIEEIKRPPRAEQNRVIELDTESEVPAGKWFKKFPGFTVCGEGRGPRPAVTC
jgi:hypothetical protein